MSTISAKASKVTRKAGRALDLAPHLIRTPSHFIQGLKGVHIGILESLDKEWLKAIGIGTVLDVGANTGQFALAAHHVLPDAQIYSFEPLPSCVVEMRQRMSGMQGFTAFATAIGDHDGTITIHQSKSSPSSSILGMTKLHTEAFPWTLGGGDLEVEIHRLDYFLPQISIERKVLLKIDVQGYTLPVLAGATLTLQQAELVFIETSFVGLYQDEATFDQVYSKMTEAGFEFRWILGPTQAPTVGSDTPGRRNFQTPLVTSWANTSHGTS